MEIRNRFEEAVKRLKSRGEIVTMPGKDGRIELYHKTVGESVSDGEMRGRAFYILTPIALTEEFAKLSQYVEQQEKRYERIQHAESTLRI
jgi:hypothetical protein